MCIDKSANIVGTFYKKELQKMNKKFRIEKVFTRKAINYMLNEKAAIIH